MSLALLKRRDTVSVSNIALRELEQKLSLSLFRAAEGLRAAGIPWEERVAHFGDTVFSLLTDAHARATYVGRYRAGDVAPIDEDDRRFAEEVMRGEDAFLARFEDALRSGRYTREDGSLKQSAILSRLSLYRDRVGGTANEAFALAAGGLLHWRLGEEAVHCPECPKLAEGSPYPWDQIPTYPRAGETTCLSRCRCRLETEDGIPSFEPPSL